MTSVTGFGSGSEARNISISSCFKCEKVISLVDQLTKNMHEFEIVTMEMEFDLKSAKSKSSQVLSNFWQLISMIKSIKFTGEKEETGKDSCENPNPTSSKLSVTLEKQRVESRNLENESENQDENEAAQSESEFRSADKTRRRKNLKLKRNPNPKVPEKRLIELQRANRLLRTIKCETQKGFYNVFECSKCERQFNDKNSARRHVKVQHLSLGTDRCPTCRNPYFDKKLLELHIPKCSQKTQLHQIKVWLRNDSKKPVKVQLQAHKKQQQKEPRATRNRKSGRKIQTQDAEEKRGKRTFDFSRLKVRNPFENFSIVKAMNVKVVIERLDMEESGKISSKSHTEIQTTEKIDMETGKETSSSEGDESESCVAALNCDEV